MKILGFSLLFCLVGLVTFGNQTASAHVFVNTDYHLLYSEIEGWQIEVRTKTSALYQEVIAQNPHLAGQNMNSDEFKAAALKYLSAGVQLSNQNQKFTAKGLSIHFGGHQTEAILLIADLPQDIKSINIAILSFTDQAEHIINTIYVQQNGAIKKFSLDQMTTEVFYNFEQHQFETTPSEAGLFSFIPLWFQLVVLAVVIGRIVAYLIYLT